MTNVRPKTKQTQNWLPGTLQGYIGKKLKQKPPAGQAYKVALKRLIDPADIALTDAYKKLQGKHDPAFISKFLEDVCDAFLDIELYHPMREIDYKDWLRKISKMSVELAHAIDKVPSSDLTVPDELRNVHSLLASLLEGYGDDLTIEEYSRAGKTLRRSLKQIPISMLLRQLAVLAEKEVCRPPHHYWEKELGIKVSKKQGSDGAIGREQILIKLIKKITLAHFKKPYYELVATLVNALTGSAKHSGDSISKTPK